jgi:hypothetical protein
LFSGKSGKMTRMVFLSAFSGSSSSRGSKFRKRSLSLLSGETGYV